MHLQHIKTHDLVCNPGRLLRISAFELVLRSSLVHIRHTGLLNHDQMNVFRSHRSAVVFEQGAFCLHLYAGAVRLLADEVPL